MLALAAVVELQRSRHLPQHIHLTKQNLTLITRRTRNVFGKVAKFLDPGDGHPNPTAHSGADSDDTSIQLVQNKAGWEY